MNQPIVDYLVSTLASDLKDFDGNIESVVLFAFGRDETRWMSNGTDDGAHIAAANIRDVMQMFLDTYQTETGIDPEQTDAHPADPANATEAERITKNAIERMKRHPST